jgi:monothiol glutaredoxin
MPRAIVQPAQIHPDIADRVATRGSELIATAQAAVTSNHVVIIGMSQNPNVKRARRALEARNIAFEYLEYGSYLKGWSDRLGFKMWTGWPTFPMVFVDGTLIGGANEVEKLLGSGELK